MSKKFFLLLILISSASQLQAQNSQYDLDQGIQAYRAGEYERALRLFDRVIQYNRESAEAYLYRGNTHFILGHFPEAEQDFTHSLENRFRSQPSSSGGTFRTRGMTIMEPDPVAGQNDVLALLYNNRGAARYLQGKQSDAMADFDRALSHAPNLQYARDNIDNGSGRRPTDSWSQPNDSWNARRGLERPVDPIRWDDIDELTETAEDVRDYRENGRLSGLAGLFQPRPFSKRSIPRRGKVYQEPNTGAATQTYLRIVEVEINDRETLVTIGITNNERRSFYARIFPPGRPESYVLADRNPDPRSGARYELVKVNNQEITSNTGLQVRPGEEFTVTLVFPKLDDDIGYVNLVEGSLQVDYAWNFYDIDLTR